MKNNILWLNPIYKLLEPKRSALFLILLALDLYIFLFSEGNLALRIAFALILPIGYILYGTKKITLSRGRIDFTYNHVLRRFRNSHTVRVKYTVTNIHYLKFEQNAIEKFFDCGHFSFSGNTEYETNAHEIDAKTSFTFYGLTHFRQTKKEICDILGVNETE